MWNLPVSSLIFPTKRKWVIYRFLASHLVGNTCRLYLREWLLACSTFHLLFASRAEGRSDESGKRRKEKLLEGIVWKKDSEVWARTSQVSPSLPQFFTPAMSSSTCTVLPFWASKATFPLICLLQLLGYLHIAFTITNSSFTTAAVSWTAAGYKLFTAALQSILQNRDYLMQTAENKMLFGS